MTQTNIYIQLVVWIFWIILMISGAGVLKRMTNLIGMKQLDKVSKYIWIKLFANELGAGIVHMVFMWITVAAIYNIYVR